MKVLWMQPSVANIKASDGGSDPDPSSDDNDDGLVMIEGQDAEEMYVIIEGSKTILLESSGEKLGVLSAGDFFGELGALLPPSMAKHRRRTRTAYAVGETQLGLLTFDDLLWLRKESFEVSERVVAYVNHIAEHLGDRDDIAKGRTKKHSTKKRRSTALDGADAKLSAEGRCGGATEAEEEEEEEEEEEGTEGAVSEPMAPPLSLLDPFPELAVIDKKMTKVRGPSLIFLPESYFISYYSTVS